MWIDTVFKHLKHEPIASKDIQSWLNNNVFGWKTLNIMVFSPINTTWITNSTIEIGSLVMNYKITPDRVFPQIDQVKIRILQQGVEKELKLDSNSPSVFSDGSFEILEFNININDVDFYQWDNKQPVFTNATNFNLSQDQTNNGVNQSSEPQIWKQYFSESWRLPNLKYGMIQFPRFKIGNQNINLLCNGDNLSVTDNDFLVEKGQNYSGLIDTNTNLTHFGISNKVILFNNFNNVVPYDKILLEKTNNVVSINHNKIVFNREPEIMIYRREGLCTQIDNNTSYDWFGLAHTIRVTEAGMQVFSTHNIYDGFSPFSQIPTSDENFPTLSATLNLQLQGSLSQTLIRNSVITVDPTNIPEDNWWNTGNDNNFITYDSGQEYQTLSTCILPWASGEDKGQANTTKIYNEKGFQIRNAGHAPLLRLITGVAGVREASNNFFIQTDSSRAQEAILKINAKITHFPIYKNSQQFQIIPVKLYDPEKYVEAELNDGNHSTIKIIYNKCLWINSNSLAGLFPSSLNFLTRRTTDRAMISPDLEKDIWTSKHRVLSRFPEYDSYAKVGLINNRPFSYCIIAYAEPLLYTISDNGIKDVIQVVNVKNQEILYSLTELTASSWKDCVVRGTVITSSQPVSFKIHKTNNRYDFVNLNNSVYTIAEDDLSLCILASIPIIYDSNYRQNTQLYDAITNKMIFNCQTNEVINNGCYYSQQIIIRGEPIKLNSIKYYDGQTYIVKSSLILTYITKVSFKFNSGFRDVQTEIYDQNQKKIVNCYMGKIYADVMSGDTLYIKGSNSIKLNGTICKPGTTYTVPNGITEIIISN